MAYSAGVPENGLRSTDLVKKNKSNNVFFSAQLKKHSPFNFWPYFLGWGIRPRHRRKQAILSAHPPENIQLTAWELNRREAEGALMQRETPRASDVVPEVPRQAVSPTMLAGEGNGQADRQTAHLSCLTKWQLSSVPQSFHLSCWFHKAFVTNLQPDTLNKFFSILHCSPQQPLFSYDWFYVCKTDKCKHCFKTFVMLVMCVQLAYAVI